MFLLPRTVTDHGNFYVSLLSGTVNEDVNFRAVFFFLIRKLQQESTEIERKKKSNPIKEHKYDK